MPGAIDCLQLAYTEGQLPTPGRAIFLRGEHCQTFAKWPQLTHWQPLRGHYEALVANGGNCAETLAELDRQAFEVAIILPGKDRVETLALFAEAADLITESGRVVVAMPNAAGASRYQKELQRALGPIDHLSKFKCRTFWTESGAASHDEALLTQWRESATPQNIKGTSFVTTPGIYGAGQIDPGSAFLAKHLPKRLRGVAADLGSGWGYLSRELLERCTGVRELHLYEHDCRAIDCSRSNVPSAKVDLHFHWHDVTTGIPVDSYDTIVMNPPFHTGVTSDVGLGKCFIRNAAAALKKHGELWMVANTHLPYEAALEATGLRWRAVAEDERFKVFSATRSR